VPGGAAGRPRRGRVLHDGKRDMRRNLLSNTGAFVLVTLAARSADGPHIVEAASSRARESAGQLQSPVLSPASRSGSRRGPPIGLRSEAARCRRARRRYDVSVGSSMRLRRSLLNCRRNQSGREDLNLRLLGPEPSALPGCATPRTLLREQRPPNSGRAPSPRPSLLSSRNGDGCISPEFENAQDASNASRHAMLLLTQAKILLWR
jgi:hypothetical protein